MPYKAIKNIGGYRIGDTVPDAKANLWLKMYANPQVELVSVPVEVKLPEPVEVKVPKPKVKVDMDLNNDGKEDEKDVRLAAKITRKLGSKLKKKRK